MAPPTFPQTITASLCDVRPNPNQPRKTFDPAKLQELADSIRENGLLQPITVTPRDDYYLIVAGERRWRACELAGLPTITAIVQAYDDATVARLALIENVQREDMDPIDTARAYQAMADAGATPAEVGRVIGKNSTEVCMYLALNRLDPGIADAVKRRLISTRVGCDLARLDDTNDQRTIFSKIVHGDLPTAQASAFITSWLDTKNTGNFFGPAETPAKAEARKHRVRTIKDRIEAASRSLASLLAAVENADEDAAELSTIDLFTVEATGKAFAKLHTKLAVAAQKRRIISEVQCLTGTDG